MDGGTGVTGVKMNNLTLQKARTALSELQLAEKNIGLSLREEVYKASLERSVAELEQQERGEGDWIEWSGDDYEPDITPKLQIKRRDGVTDDGYLNNFWWGHIGDDSDIIAYRIIPEQATSHNGEQ